MKSVNNSSEVTTIFCHTENPIFPTTVFNNYGSYTEVSLIQKLTLHFILDFSFKSAEDKLYYVAELVQYVERIA